MNLNILQYFVLIAILLISLSCGELDEYICNYQTVHSGAWNSTIQDFESCLACRINDVNFLERGKTIQFVNDTGSLQSSNVKLIRIDKGTVNFIPMIELLQAFPHVENLDFWFNTEVINAEFFGDASKLKYITSLENSLTIEANAFSTAINLEMLALDFNNISSIHPTAFLGLKNLIRLDLDNNNLGSLNEMWFHDLQKLQTLFLEDNKIVNLESKVFNSLVSLRILVLTSNQIKVIPLLLFEMNVKLEAILLANNKLTEIQAESFLNLKLLEVLDLEGNVCVDKVLQNETLTDVGLDLVNCYHQESMPLVI